MRREVHSSPSHAASCCARGWNGNHISTLHTHAAVRPHTYECTGGRAGLPLHGGDGSAAAGSADITCPTHILIRSSCPSRSVHVCMHACAQGQSLPRHPMQGQWRSGTALSRCPRRCLVSSQKNKACPHPSPNGQLAWNACSALLCCSLRPDTPTDRVVGTLTRPLWCV